MRALHMRKKTREEKRADRARCCFEWAEAVLGSILIVVILFTFFFGVKRVDGDSMHPTLYGEDRILLTSLFYHPSPKDIVVVAHDAEYQEPLVKRVIATAGQTVNITRTGEVYVDDVLQEESYIDGAKTSRGEQTYPLTVPEGCVFVMGDNRMNSLDSRFFEVDCIDERSIIGKVQCVIFPFDRIQTFS